MASFDQDGNYELRYNDHANVSFASRISAVDDGDALGLAVKAQHPGLALQLWRADRLIHVFPTKPRGSGIGGVLQADATTAHLAAGTAPRVALSAEP